MKYLSMLLFPLLCFAWETECQGKKASVYVEGEFLYWNAQEHGLAFALTDGTELRNAGSLLQVEHGKVIAIDSTWDLGFRAILGGCLPFDQWEIKAGWTHFDTDIRKTAHAKPGTFLAILANSFSARRNNQVDIASAKWELDYDTLDLCLTREFVSTPRLTLTPFLGVKSGWIEQHFNVNYHFSLVLVSPANLPTTKISKDRLKFWGIGPLGGLASQWKLTEHWSLNGNLAGALLYGQFNYRYASAGGKTLQSNYTQKYHLSRFTYQLALGIQWSSMFRKSKNRIEIDLQWELNDWFGMNKFFNNISEPFGALLQQRNEDLILQGLIAGLRFDF